MSMRTGVSFEAKSRPVSESRRSECAAVHRWRFMVSPHSLHHIGVPQYTGYSLVISLLTFLAGEAVQRR
jgi:hypothetical protein